jgi:hypothetical protein
MKASGTMSNVSGQYRPAAPIVAQVFLTSLLLVSFW